MSDPIRVRFPCPEHGIWFRHMVKPVGVKPEWCEGGQTKLLEHKMLWPPEANPDKPLWVWVEVEE